MTFYDRSSRWAAALVLALAGPIAVGVALVLAAPAPSATSAFELTLEVTDTGQSEGDGVNAVFEHVGTFRSRAPFCEAGTFEYGSSGVLEKSWRLTCDDGTGSVTVAIPQAWYAGFTFGDATWRILDGTGSYAGLRGRGSLRGELLGSEISETRSVQTWRATFHGVVDRDVVAPTIAFSRATATKLRRLAGAYVLRLGVALRDNVTDNPVSYTLRASAGGVEIARKVGTATTGAVSMTLRIRPPAGARTVRLMLTGEDPVGNAGSARRALSLRR